MDRELRRVFIVGWSWRGDGEELSDQMPCTGETLKTWNRFEVYR